MATKMDAAAQPRREQAEDPAEAARRRWARAAEGLAEGDPVGQAGSFAQQRTIGAKVEARPPRQPAPAAAQDATATERRSGARLGMYTVMALLGALLVYVLVSSAVSWVRVTLDDIQYGRPRTAHLEAYVGHAGEQAGMPSHFIALNLNRRVVVIELPGGSTEGATTITGPYLFGQAEELTPVRLNAEDLNGDGAPDLLLSVADEQLVYINDRAGNTFRLTTPDEQAALRNSAARGGSDPALEGVNR